MRWLKRGLFASLAVGGIAFLVYAWLPKPVSVDLALVRHVSLDVEVAEDGQTRVRDRYVVAAPITGNLLRIDLEPGTTVERGAQLARIEPPTPGLLDQRTRRETEARLAAALARERRAEVAISGAAATHRNAALDAARSRRLLATGAITATENERASLAEELASRDLVAARNDRAGAAAEVVAIRVMLGAPAARDSSTTIAVPSPISGVVLRVPRESAGPVVAGTPLVEVGDPKTLEVVVDVLSRDAARIRVGMTVELDGWGGDGALPGVVRRIEPSAFTRISALGVEEQRVNVVVGLENPPPMLGDGFRVEARIFTWRGDNVLAVPASALFRDQGQWAVYALENGRARLRHVQTGHRGRLDVEILGGLVAGTPIVLHPSDSVRDGVRVMPR